MLSIRLSRTGKAHAPHYRIVVQERRSKLLGKAVANIGHYHPADKVKSLVIDKEAAAKWLKEGAQPSDTVANLLVKEGLLDKSHKVTRFYTAKPKEEAPVKAEVKVETKEEPTSEPTPEESPEVETETAEEEVDATPETVEEPAPEEK